MPHRSRTAHPSSATITWYGHSAFSIRSPKGVTVIVDPWLDNPKAPPDALAQAHADVILVTHGHGDHFGNTVELAKRTGAHVFAIYEISVYLQSQGVQNVHGLNKSGTGSFQGVHFTMTHAEHSGGLEPGGPIISGGDPAGFVIRLENGQTIYHAGDTGVFGDMQLIGHLYKPHIVMLPIGGAVTMGPAEAAYACRLLKPQHIIGMHYGTNPTLEGTPEQLKTHLPESMKKKVLILTPGEAVEM
jgi:L-ascorbate metabolism protein UlaG (beta-lactamase superfamily)